MWRTLGCLGVLGVLTLLHWTLADSDFCARPANMDLCWWRNNLYKRYLRFGRGGDPYLRFGRGGDPYLRFGRGGDPYLRFGRGGDPYLRFGRGGDPYLRFGRGGDPYLRFGRGDPYLRFGRGDPYLRFGRGDPYLRFGRSQPESWRFNPFSHLGMGKRDADSDSLDQYLENGGYLRFGRSETQSPQTPLENQSEDSDVLRKKRDVSETPDSSPEVYRTARNVKDGGFLTFGRSKVLDNAVEDAASLPSEEDSAKPANAVNSDSSDVESSESDDYLQFNGRSMGFGKRNYLRFGRTLPEGYLRFGKRLEGRD